MKIHRFSRGLIVGLLLALLVACTPGATTPPAAGSAAPAPAGPASGAPASAAPGVITY